MGKSYITTGPSMDVLRGHYTLSLAKAKIYEMVHGGAQPAAPAEPATLAVQDTFLLGEEARRRLDRMEAQIQGLCVEIAKVQRFCVALAQKAPPRQGGAESTRTPRSTGRTTRSVGSGSTFGSQKHSNRYLVSAAANDDHHASGEHGNPGQHQIEGSYQSSANSSPTPKYSSNQATPKVPGKKKRGRRSSKVAFDREGEETED